MLAAIWAMEKFQTYLHGKSFYFETNSKSHSVAVAVSSSAKLLVTANDTNAELQLVLKSGSVAGTQYASFIDGIGKAEKSLNISLTDKNGDMLFQRKGAGYSG